jgi:hypothetical protein
MPYESAFSTTARPPVLDEFKSHPGNCYGLVANSALEFLKIPNFKGQFSRCRAPRRIAGERGGQTRMGSPDAYLRAVVRRSSLAGRTWFTPPGIRDKLGLEGPPVRGIVEESAEAAEESRRRDAEKSRKVELYRR